jgi:UDP-N-acetylmuramate dehydrogenase
MAAQLPLRYDVSLKQHNTFGIDASARAYADILSVDDLHAVRADTALSAMPRLVLGGGSNILLTKDFPGLVLHMDNRGIAIAGETNDAILVTACAGETWHEFVQWTIGQGFCGLENLSLIPGNVGAAPIQNIGAYGVELKDRFYSLTAFDFVTGETIVLDKAACNFAYRDSIFKHALRDRAVILDVTFALPKHWQPNMQYADVSQELAARGIATPSARDIADAVIVIRTRKLPDPARIGNAGSFFKNPVVPASVRNALMEQHADLISYPQSDGSYKLAAGWLIDQCGWKGRTLGNAGVYEKQALVLVNRGGAAGNEIAALAAAIQKDVQARFGVMLEPEPVFI